MFAEDHGTYCAKNATEDFVFSVSYFTMQNSMRLSILYTQSHTILINEL